MAYEWTDEELARLFKLAIVHGNKWGAVAQSFDCSKDACRIKFHRNDWDLFWSNQGSSVAEAMAEIESELCDDDETIGNQTEELINAERLRILERGRKRQEQEMARRLAEQSLVTEKILASVAQAPHIPTAQVRRPRQKNKCREQEACLAMSDLHIGLACEPEDVGGLGNYSIPVFIRRLNNLVESVARITDYHRTAHEIQKLNLFLLGDNVHGSNDAGKWGFLHTSQNVMDQIFTAVAELEKAILRLKTVFPEIEVYCVYGNHGRISRPGMDKAFCNWDYLIYKFLEGAIAPNNPDIRFHIPKAPFQVAQVMTQKFLLIHGDQVKMWNNIPFYGMLRAEGRYRNMLTRQKNLNELWANIEADGIDLEDTKGLLDYALNYARGFDYLVMGHFHQPAEIPAAGGGRLILNDSFVGGDDFTINKLMIAGTASQKFFGVHPEGKSWSYDIDLDRSETQEDAA